MITICQTYKNETTQTLFAKHSYSGLEKSHANKYSRCIMKSSLQGKLLWCSWKWKCFLHSFSFSKEAKLLQEDLDPPSCVPSGILSSECRFGVPLKCFQATAPEAAAVSTGGGSSSQTHKVRAAASPCSSCEVLSCLPGSWAVSSLCLRPQAPASSLRIGNFIWDQPYCPLLAPPSQASPDPWLIWHTTTKSHCVRRSHPHSCDMMWDVGNAWIHLAMSRYFTFVFIDSGLSYSAHQHVWQYRDTALAWRRLQPSVLLNDRKDESGFARP